MIPAHDAIFAWRLACYLGGLILFGAERLVEFYSLHGSHIRLATVLHSTLPIVGVALFYLASRDDVPHALRRMQPYARLLLAIGLLGTLLLSARGLRQIAGIPAALAQPHHYLYDSVAMPACGVDLLARGENPYVAFSLIACLPANGLNGTATTPLQAGAFAHSPNPSFPTKVRVFAQALTRHERRPAAFESSYSYPAGSFVLPFPFVQFVRHDLSAFYLLCILLAYLLLVGRAPPWLRPWILLCALGNLAMWAYAAGSASDSLEVLLVLAAWATWRRAWVSAALLGLAVATRQNAWFFLPFYAILVNRFGGSGALARRLAIVAGVFALLNGPFALPAPAAWLDGVLAPLRDPMYALGGLTDLFNAMGLPVWPRQAYTLLELGALGICTLFYARTCRDQPATGLALAFVPLLCGWRSEFMYVLPLAILALWPMVDDARFVRGTDDQDASARPAANAVQ